jgi:polyisoprenoid-binding protein YceI
MRRRSIHALVSLLCLAPASIAWRSAGDPLTLAPQSRLWIDGTSTVRKFSCKATELDVEVDAAPGAVAAVLTGAKAVKSVTLRVPAEKIECGNGTMNEHMKKALKVKDAPTIEFKLSGYDVAKGGAGVQGNLNGTLTLGGQTKPITVAAQAADGGNGQLRVTGAVVVNMKEYGLKPPSLMMGTMKVGENVTVNFDLLLQGSVQTAEGSR